MQFHGPVFRTQSEEPPRSPREMLDSMHNKSIFDPTYATEIFPQQHILLRSQNLSQGSTVSGRSLDYSKLSQESVPYSVNDNNYADANTVNYTECIDFMERATQLPFDSNSLPRRKCSYHANEYQTNSLPRKDANQIYRDAIRTTSNNFDGNVNNAHAQPLLQFRTHGTFSIESNMGSNQNLNDSMQRRYSCGIQHLNQADFENMKSILRRNSMDAFYYTQDNDYDEDNDEEIEDEEDEINDDESESEEYCSTCESDSESQLQREIFIDFKPSISPVHSRRRKRLQKTVSDGEMLMEKRIEFGPKEATITSTSEEELKIRENDNATVIYSNLPIKDEGIFNNNNLCNLLKPPIERDINANNRREAFRKRSISLEESGDEKSGSDGSKGADDKDKNISTFPSSDSLANDLTRDHSDANWNESQATVLQIDQRWDQTTISIEISFIIY